MKGLLILPVLLLSGCSTVMVDKLVPATSQEVVYERGQEILISKGVQGSVAIALTSGENVIGERLKLEVYTVNGGAKAYNFGLENVSAQDEKGAMAELIPYETVAKEIRSAAGAALIGQALAGSAMALTPTTTTTTTSGYGAAGPYMGTSTSTTYSPGANLANSAAMADRSERTIDRAEADIARTGATYLRTTTIGPGRDFYGYFFLRPAFTGYKGPAKYKIVVLIGDEKHEFLLSRNRKFDPSTASR